MDAPKLERCPYCGGEAAIERITVGNGVIEAYNVGCSGLDRDGGLCNLNRLRRLLVHRTPRIAGCKWNDRAELISRLRVRRIDDAVAATVPELLDLLRYRQLGGATWTQRVLTAYLTDASGQRQFMGQIAVGLSSAGDGICGADITLEIASKYQLGVVTPEEEQEEE